jgi:hypothetical protein
VIESWKRLNPNHTHHLWDDEDMRKFMVQVSTAAVGTAKALIKQLCAAVPLCRQQPAGVCSAGMCCAHNCVLPVFLPCPSAALP